jgi:hypothetical protein
MMKAHLSSIQFRDFSFFTYRKCLGLCAGPHEANVGTFKGRRVMKNTSGVSDAEPATAVVLVVE